MCDISRTVEDRVLMEYIVHICRVDWHNNGWPWVNVNGHFMHRALSAVACCMHFNAWLSYLK